MKARTTISAWVVAGIIFTVIAIYLKSDKEAVRKISSVPVPVMKVGILHSLTGTMDISERPVVDATLLAIEEINSRGGVLGMRLEPVIVDGRSDPDVFNKEAEIMITKDRVPVIFGCWTSASRKAVKPIVEKYDSLLFYPVQYEGLEESVNIIYMGSAPNQQLIPAVTWSLKNLGRRFFLVGSDYVFPRVANEIAGDVVRAFGGEILGEEYVVLGSTDFSEIAEKIKEAKPEVILNTLNGDSNIAFFEALREAGIEPDKISVMSLSIAENEIQAMEESFKRDDEKGPRHAAWASLAGTYACWSYFQSIQDPLNASFVAKFKARYGQNRVISDPMEAAYIGVYIWSEAAKESGSVYSTQDIRNNIYHISLPAPEGIVSVADNNHARKMARIGKINDKGGFDILWDSRRAIEPDPYPVFKSDEDWKKFLEGLYRSWDGHWHAVKSKNNAGEER